MRIHRQLMVSALTLALILGGTAAMAQLSGLQVVAKVNVNTPDFTRLTVSCPAGKRLVGGGAEALGSNSILNGSFPVDDATWAAVGHQPGVGNLGLSVYGVCASTSDSHIVSRVNVNTPDFTRLTVDCPSGHRLTGCGGEALGSNSILNGFFPVDDNTCAAVGHQPGVGNLGLSAYAVCADASDSQIVSRVNVNTKDFTRLNVACPKGMGMTGGGAEALGSNSILNGGFPADGTWAAIGHQPGVGNLGLSSYAICAN